MTAATATLPDMGVDDIRPLVGRESGNRPLWMGLAAILLAGAVLFALLEAQRENRSAPAVRPKASDLALAPLAVPPLYLPPEAPASLPVAPAPQPSPTPSPVPPVAIRPLPNPVAMPPMSPPTIAPPAATPSAPKSTGPAIVYDASVAASSGNGSANEIVSTAIRAKPAPARDRSKTVPQGTLIAAVLETALDSTQAGQARALVSNDVANLAGGRTLIPRGSRLFGDYKADIGQGQNRVQIVWTRLIRPDGVTVALDAPAVDRLGRAGVKGEVNTHFFERLANALLQSSLDVGTAVAARSIQSGSVVVALPGSVSSTTSQLIPPAPKPTICVRAGTRIGVLVSRDLDFSGVGDVR
jgi:type IV secretion system protein VirB10